MLGDALAANRLVARISVAPGVNLAEISPSGETIYHFSWDEGVVRAIDVATRDILWEFPDDGSSRPLRSMAISRNGNLLAFDEEPPGEPPATVVLNAAEGTLMASIPSEGCHWKGAISGGIQRSRSKDDC